MAFYTNPIHWTGFLGPLDAVYLNLAGSNYYPVPFQVVPGTIHYPGLSIQGDNKTGLGSDLSRSNANLFFTMRGFEGFRFELEQMTVFNNEGHGITLQLPTGLTASFDLTLPARTSRLVCVDDFVTEDLTGTIDGVNDTFTTSHNILKILDVQADGSGGVGVASFSDDEVVLSTPPSGVTTLRIIYIRE